MPDMWEACPPSITAAAKPLRSAGELLRTLSDDSSAVTRLGEGSPSLDVQQALAEFVDRWRAVLWDTGGALRNLGHQLERAASDYIGSEAHLTQQLRELRVDREGRTR